MQPNTGSGNFIDIDILIDTTSGRKHISPLIYGINGVHPSSLTTTAMRLGGNRTTGYNWENNLSNAGEDWHNFNDDYLVPKDKNGSIPAITITDFVENAKRANAYALITLPMAGYAANDNNKTVSENETAPSSRFAVIKDRKNSPLSLEPDLKDGVVYSDELVNYLINKLGKAGSGGVSGYSLDNEPALWPSTHPRIHPQKPSIAEILERSISLASVVKDYDPDAEVFGPALYGVGAYATFQDAPDWKGSYASNYKWFIDAYLEGMRKEAEKTGRRLLDVLDVHYYTEARCPLDHRISDDRNIDDGCIYTRFQSTRSLWDAAYREKSWIAQYLNQFLPILPVLNKSIEQYYPGTKLSISEYNFGNENHVSGGIAQADALGVFATNGVYFAALWALSDKLAYAYAGINLYTNYDGAGGMFADTLVKSSTSNIESSSVFTSVDKTGVLHIVLLNKSIHDGGRFSVKIQSGTVYKNFKCYGFDSGSPSLKLISSGNVDKDNVFICEMPPMSAYHIVLE